MPQREGNHDKTDKIRQKRMPKKKRTSCSLSISSKMMSLLILDLNFAQK